MSEYTTITKVREKCTKFTGATPPDANITNFIIQSSAIVEAYAKRKFTSTQAEGSIIEQLATDIAARYCVVWNSEAFSTDFYASMTASILGESIDKNLELLKDQEVINFILSTP